MTIKIIAIELPAIEQFEDRYSIREYGFPDELDHIMLVMADNGDLVDYDMFDEHDKEIELSPYTDQLALFALFDDAFKYAIRNHQTSTMIDTGYTFNNYPNTLDS